MTKQLPTLYNTVFLQPPTHSTDPEDNNDAVLSPFEKSMALWYLPHQKTNMLLKKPLCQGL